MKKKVLFNLLRVGISAGLIAFLCWLMRGNLVDVIGAIKGARRSFLFLSFFFFLAGMVLLAVRLRAIMTAQHLAVTFKEALYLVFIGQFFSNFLPTSTGGDIVKAYYASKKTGRATHTVASIIVDRLLGTFTLVLMVMITSLCVKKVFFNHAIKVFIMIALAVSLFVLGVLFSKRIARKMPFLGLLSRRFNAERQMKDVYEVIYNYRRHPALLLNAACISLVLQAVIFYSAYLVTKSLGHPVPLKLVFLWMPIVSTAAMAPSINGLGVREGSMVFFFGQAMGREGAFAMSIVWLGLNFSASLIGGLMYLFSSEYRIPKKEVLYDR